MAQENCPIFCYHGVKQDPRPWDVSRQRFSEQVEWLSQNFNILTVSEMSRRQREGNLPENPAALTFDDGLKSSFKARQVLNEHDVKATFYIISGLLGDHWEGEEVVSREEVQILVDEGHEVGAHTVSHPHLTDLRKASVKKEVQASKNTLEQVVEDSVTSFAYPYGDFSTEAAEIVEETGFETGLTTRPSTGVNFSRPYRMPRLTVFRWHKMSHIKRFARARNYMYRNYWHLPFNMLKNGAISFPLKKEYRALKSGFPQR